MRLLKWGLRSPLLLGAFMSRTGFLYKALTFRVYAGSRRDSTRLLQGLYKASMPYEGSSSGKNRLGVDKGLEFRVGFCKGYQKV